MQRLIILLAAALLTLTLACADTWRPDPSRDIKSTQATIEAKAAAYRESLPGTITPVPTPEPTVSEFSELPVRTVEQEYSRFNEAGYRSKEPFILRGCVVAQLGAYDDRAYVATFDGRYRAGFAKAVVSGFDRSGSRVVPQPGYCYDWTVKFEKAIRTTEGPIPFGRGHLTPVFRVVHYTAFEPARGRIDSPPPYRPAWASDEEK